MKEILIEELAYLLKQAKDNNQPQPIFFLGAGASETGNIPLANEIVKNILEEYPDNPFIKKIDADNRSYSKLMECLQPYERNELLKGYIDKAKINVTHIYLAQLLRNGYVDYVFTVNFDNLMLRALALFNEFPSTYDMAILKDLTTSTFNERSVVYLHGQHHGLWLLNTKDEMDKVGATVPRIFDSVKGKRPWIFIGYSGSDPIFEHIKGLGRFDNGLYWVGYNDNSPSKEVQEFLKTPNTNANYIKGYDSDAFMLKLNETLGLGQPAILDKPFSSLQAMLDEINDDDHFKGVKERLEIAKKDVIKSISQFELKETVIIDEKELESDKLKKAIIDLVISETYPKDRIEEIAKKAKELNNVGVNNLLAELYTEWGVDFGLKAKAEGSLHLYKLAIEKFEKAIEFKPDYFESYNNWGNSLGKLAKIEDFAFKEELYKSAFEKFEKAIEIEPNNYESIYNLGIYLAELANLKKGNKKEEYYTLSIKNMKKVIDVNPEAHDAYNNLGVYLSELANLKRGKSQLYLFEESFSKFEKAIEINPNKYGAFVNWGNSLVNLAKLKRDSDMLYLFDESFEKFEKATKLNPGRDLAYSNWGNSLGALAKLKEGEEMEMLYKAAQSKLELALELGGSYYNLACLFALQNLKDEALRYLDLSLSQGEEMINYILGDEEWADFLQDPDFKKIIEKYKNRE